MFRSPIGLAEVAEAFRYLRPTERGCTAIAKALGLAHVRISETVGDRRSGPELTVVSPQKATKLEDLTERLGYQATIGGAISPEAVPIELEQIRNRVASGDWPAAVRASQPLPSLRTNIPEPPTQCPILPRRVLRAFLQDKFNHEFQTKTVDVDKLVEQLARCRLLAQLPYRHRKGFHLGVHVWIDKGPAMRPFRADVDELLRALRRIIGTAILEEFYFNGASDLAGSYSLPPRGTTVLIVTDLGIGRPPGQPRSTPKDWVAFAKPFVKSGSRVVALVPYGPDRWPRVLGHWVEIVHWHATRASVAGDPRDQLLRLAKVASVAAKLDPAFLREARLTFLPESDAGLEADLAFSTLIEVWNSRAITFRDEILRQLRGELAENRTELVRVLLFLQRYRRRTRADLLVRIEENLVFRALRRSYGDEVKIRSRLARLVRTLLEKDDDWGLARWALSCIPELPEWVRKLEIARYLQAAAALRLGFSSQDVDIEKLGGEDVWLLPPATKVGVAWTGHSLIFHEPPDPGNAVIDVPATNPRIVFARSVEHQQRIPVTFHAGQQSTIPMPRLPAEIATLSGAYYRVRGVQIPNKTCFVIMGFGTKADYTQPKTFNLDKTYRDIIKPAALAAGFDCTRADEIVHAGNINVPMYERLLKADVVVADVSTYDCIAFYELGVRHALRPYTTIIISEDRMTFPFDVGQIAVRKYHHLGEDIEYDEVERMKKELSEAMRMSERKVNDSPVYTFIKDLKPPIVTVAEDILASEATFPLPAPTASAPAPAVANSLMQQAQKALQENEFSVAKALFADLHKEMPNDLSVIHKLALATFKARLPTEKEALEEAFNLLAGLDPDQSTDTETLGLLQAVHKRLWKLTGDRSHLENAIWCSEKGFYLKNDYYNGINLAYLYNVRASISESPDAIADFVVAQRTCRRVVDICQAFLDETKTKPGARVSDRDATYWVLDALAEAWTVLGDGAKAKEYQKQALALDPRPPQWMIDSTRERVKELQKLISDSLGRMG